MRHNRLSCLLVVCLVIFVPGLWAQAYVIWQAGVPGIDQSTEFPPQNSKLAGYSGNHVSDTDLAAMIMGLKSTPKIMWVFGHCFGAGMFDELNGIANIQVGISASLYNQASNYPLTPDKGGNGFDFIWALVGFPPIHRSPRGPWLLPIWKVSESFPKRRSTTCGDQLRRHIRAGLAKSRGRRRPFISARAMALAR
jgi:hypothetical protein